MLKEHQRSCCHLTKGTSGTAASTQQLARGVSAVRKMNRSGKKCNKIDFPVGIPFSLRLLRLYELQVHSCNYS
jgi:hypothetical protein